jgi:hypothetical protein
LRWGNRVQVLDLCNQAAHIDMSSDAVWSGNNHTNTNIILAAGNYNDLKVAKVLVYQFLWQMYDVKRVM